MTLPQTRFDFLADVPAAEDLGRVHFVAIGGAGMSGLALVCSRLGAARSVATRMMLRTSVGVRSKAPS